MTNSENEIQQLRKTIDQKNQEIMALQSGQMEELEKMKREIMFNMESEFQARETKCKRENEVISYSVSKVWCSVGGAI